MHEQGITYKHETLANDKISQTYLLTMQGSTILVLGGNLERVESILTDRKPSSGRGAWVDEASVTELSSSEPP